MVHTRSVLLLFLILVLTITGLWFSGKTTDTPTDTTEGIASPTQADLIVESPVMAHYDAQGRVAWRITGHALQYREHDDRSTIEQPFALIRPKNDTKESTNVTQPLDASDPWQLTSQVASISNHQTHITLDGDARVRNSEVDIRCEQLQFDTQQQFATTDKAVTIVSHGATTHADGLQADLLNKHLRLPSRVKEIHEPPKKK